METRANSNLELFDLLFDSAEICPDCWHVTQFDDSVVQVVKHALRRHKAIDCEHSLLDQSE